MTPLVINGRNHPLKRAQSQPIWILIGLLLAMIIGIMMYQMVSRAGSSGGFEDLMKRIDAGTARVQLTEACSDWKRTSWSIPPSDLDQLSDYAAVEGILNQAEYNRHETISKCDCSMYLFVQKALTRSEAELNYDPDLCHEWANTEAERFEFIT